MTDHSDNGSNRPLSRRSMVLGTGGLLLGAGGIAGGANVLADDHPDGATAADDDSAESGEARMTFRSGAFVWDTDMNMELANAVQPAEDPTGEGRDGVVHATSRGEETSDYAVAGIDLREKGLMLDAASDPGTITYDYYGKTAPDEVFFLLQTGANEFAVAVRSERADGADAWETRDVSSELSADGWRAVELDGDDVDVRGEQVGVTTETIGKHILSLQQQESFADLTSRFEHAGILGMALGAGNLNGAAIDAYYDTLQVDGEIQPIPAVVPMEASFDRPRGGGGRITASLSFAADGHGLSAEDIDAESVRLAPYSPVAPPLPGTTESDNVALADDASVSADSLEAEFVPGQVQRLADGNRAVTVLVYGSFDVAEPYTFVAVGELEGAGRGN